jgi:hypothetical protein
MKRCLVISALDRIARLARKFLAGAYSSEDPVFQRINISFDRSRYLVKYYYLISAFLAYEISWDLHRAVEQSDAWDFMWPVKWLGWLGPSPQVQWLGIALFVSSLLAFQFPSKIVARSIFAALCLMIAALSNSQGAIGHGYHVWLWIGICFIFLPSAPEGSETREFKMSYLSVMVAAQALILFFYTLAGIWKVRSGLSSLYHGVEGNFSPRGLALQLADRVLITGTKPLLADFVISNYWLIWPMFLIIMYVQLTAVLVVLRPRLHLVWGYVLLSFHLGTWLLMEIGFAEQLLFVGILMLMSPFKPQKWKFRAVLADLPAVGVLTRLVWRAPSHVAELSAS